MTRRPIGVSFAGRPKACGPTDEDQVGTATPGDVASLDLDRRHAAIYALHRNLPLADVPALAGEACAGLVAAVQARPEPDVVEPRPHAWWAEPSFLDIVPVQSSEPYRQRWVDLHAVIG